MNPKPIQIAWCTTAAGADQLARFFADNVDPEYISHAELQGPRAIAPGRWRPGLAGILRDEIAGRIEREGGRIDSADHSHPILAARDGDHLVGLALVTFCPSAPIPYAIVEDIVVEQSSRGAGVGKAILDWITREAVAVKCKRLFLESGRGNDRAHHFFEREGFEICSVVMMKDLSPPS